MDKVVDFCNNDLSESSYQDIEKMNILDSENEDD